ncbi:response regulator [Enterococcus casseliflavus]|uniref:response regulator transcription factor n=1 Tax=Enterococcus TaxID=1350 RepID=UPI0039A78311
MKKMIILEDERFIRKNIVAKFQRLTDYEIVLETDNGKAVVEYAQKHLADLLITDINMPIMNGFDVIENVRKFSPKTKIVIITGYDDFYYVQRGLRLAIEDYLLKPIKETDIKHLMTRIDKGVNAGVSEQIGEQIDLFIQKYYLENITVESLAEALGYSKEYLSRKYKESFGGSIYQKIVSLRINKAKELLIEQPALDIQKVGEKVGYHDRYHFSKLFKQKTMVTPSEYRAEIIKKQQSSKEE